MDLSIFKIFLSFGSDEADEAEEDEDLAIVRNHENNLQRLKHDRQISSLLNHQPFYCLNKLYHNSKSVASTRYAFFKQLMMPR